MIYSIEILWLFWHNIHIDSIVYEERNINNLMEFKKKKKENLRGQYPTHETLGQVFVVECNGCIRDK